MGGYCTTAFVLIGVITLLGECLPAFAGEAASKSRKKAAPAIDTTALDRKVSESKHVFVGEGVRIYFVDRRYRETPYIRAAGEGAVKSAVAVVKVVKVLHPAGAEVPAQVLVPMETSRDAFGEGRSPYDRDVGRLVGRQGIWLGEIVVRKEGDDRKPLEDPVTLLQAAPGDGKRRPVAAPMPMNHLKQVMDSIARLKGGAQTAAAAPKAE